MVMSLSGFGQEVMFYITQCLHPPFFSCCSIRYGWNVADKSERLATERCKCKPIKATQKTYLRNNYNYVIRAKVKEVKTKCHDVTAVVEVKEILKSSLVNIPRDTVNLYTNSGCLCPPLHANEEYIIMGYEDEERSR
ncbi:UNVERIFIED_CONTAM: hypothetical protein K2H54_045416 [Gekko kuhli]